MPKCGSCTGSICTSWEIVRNAILPAPVHMHRIRTPGGGLQWLILRNHLGDSETPSSLSIISLKQFSEEYHPFLHHYLHPSCPTSCPSSLNLIPKLLGKLHFHEGIYPVCGEGHGNPFQYSCLENPRERGAWWAIVHGVSKSRTGLKHLSMHTHIVYSRVPQRMCHRCLTQKLKNGTPQSSGNQLGWGD